MNVLPIVIPRLFVEGKETLCVIVNQFSHAAFVIKPHTSTQRIMRNVAISVVIADEVVKILKLSTV